MARAPWAPDALYDVAALWVERCLREGRSLFLPERAVWTAAVVNEAAKVIEAGGPNESDIQGGLLGRLPGRSDPVIQCAAELRLINLLPVRDISAATKATALKQILALMAEPSSIPGPILGALDGGVASYGSGKAHLGLYMRILASFARGWSALTTDERQSLLTDPWAFRQHVQGLHSGKVMQRDALLHLVFPETFEYVIAPADKEKLRAVFTSIPAVAGAADDDRALEVIRAELEQLTGGPINFYRDRLRGIWKDDETLAWTATLHWAGRIFEWPGFDVRERDYKLEIEQRLVAAREAVRAGRNDWLELLTKAFQRGNNLTNWREHDPFLRWCGEHPADASGILAELWADEEPTLERLTASLLLFPATLGASARISLMSFLLLGRDSSAWPFYRQKVARRFRQLTGGEPAELGETDGETTTEESSLADKPAAPYLAFIGLLDELRIRLLGKGVRLRGRLDAQSLAWWLSEREAPEEWEESDRARFHAFQKQHTEPDVTATTQPVPERAWLVRAASKAGEDAIGDRDVVQEFLEGGFVAAGWADVDVTPGMDGMAIFDEVRTAYPQRPLGWWRTRTGNLNSFVNGIDVGHLVVTVDKDKIYVGRVITPYSFGPDRPLGTTRRWGVEWLNLDQPASRKAIKQAYPTLYNRLRNRLTVTDLSPDVAIVSALAGLILPPTRLVTDVLLPDVTEDLARSLHIPQAWLQDEVVELLKEKGQLVFYGPPGTGKTLVAQRVAEHIVDSPEAYELIQFHPSYSYEDFFEGYRPVQTDAGVGITYELTPGPLRRMAERAAENPDQPHVLIIDEINRGNVPKIFGELLFLLEYRKEQIPLQYSADARFGLPENLFIIATMNTADRSIALVDAALRRRFYFVAFMPREEPVKSVLAKWLERQGHDQEPAALLGLLNDRIDSDDIAVGPSYFISSDGPPNLDRVWKHSIMPLLEEHYFGTGRDVAVEFGLGALRNALAPFDAAAPQAEEEAGESPD